MAPTHDEVVHPDALELAEILVPAWDEMLARLRASGTPVCVGDGDSDADADVDADPDTDAEVDTDADADADDIDWKAQSRKHERRVKAERKAREEAERKLRERDDTDKSEHDKALEKARAEGKAEALTQSEKERRHDRLEVQATRLAARGITIGHGDDARTVRFADAEDALVNIERGIRSGDIDEDEIFDSEGKVQTDGLASALADLLKRKPHLRATATDGDDRPSGDGDGGKGSAGKSDEDMTAADHFAAVRSK